MIQIHNLMIKGILWLSVINLYVKVIKNIKKYQFISPCIFLKRKSEGVNLNFKNFFNYISLICQLPLILLIYLSMFVCLLIHLNINMRQLLILQLGL